MLAQLAPGVVQRLVERAAVRVQPLGEHVDRDAVQRKGDENTPLVRRQDLARSRRCSVASSSLCSASSSGSSPALENRLQLSGSSGTSRPCQERFRSFTAASSSANLYDPGREAAGAAEVVEAREHAHQRVVGGLRWRCRRGRRRADAAASAGGGRLEARGAQEQRVQARDRLVFGAGRRRGGRAATARDSASSSGRG